MTEPERRPRAKRATAKKAPAKKARGSTAPKAGNRRTKKAAAKIGARPGNANAGRPPMDLHAPVDYVPVYDDVGQIVDRRPVNAIEKAAQTFRFGGFQKDAAARLGVSVSTFREWLAIGAKVGRNIAAGDRLGDVTDHERQCVELLAAVEQAEAEGRMAMLGQLSKLANGGYLRERVVETVQLGADGSQTVVDRKTTTEVAEPDRGAITWWLERRHVSDFGRSRVELTGKDGAELVDLATPVDKLRQMLDTIAANSKTAPAPSPNGNGHQPAEQPSG